MFIVTDPVTFKEPVIVFVPITVLEPVIKTDPVIVLIPIKVFDPDTCKDPVTWNCYPEANARFDLLPVELPFPIIQADCAVEDILYCPCTCWYNPEAIV